MADLQALYIDAKTGARDGWKKTFVKNQPVWLGRLPNLSDWWIDDPTLTISGRHAKLTWDGSKLNIQLRDPPPANYTWFKREKVKDKFEMTFGEYFQIGQTSFTLLDETDLASEPNHDLTVRLVDTRLNKKDWQNDQNAIFFRVIEQLPFAIAVNTDEQQLFQNMTKILGSALAWANTVAVIGLVPDSGGGDHKVAIHYQREKNSPPGNDQNVLSGKPDTFTPSRKLANKAIRLSEESTRYVWEKENANDSEYTVNPQSRLGKPWAICTPIGLNTQYGLYVDGCLSELSKSLSNRTEEQELIEYQKIIDLFASLIHAGRVAIKKDRLNNLFGKFLPKGPWLEEMDESELKKVMEPRLVEATVLFCDLRGSCQIALEGAKELQQTWRSQSTILDDMTRFITANNGIVAGIQGDGVLGFWGWPGLETTGQSQTDNIDRAVKAAWQIRERFAQGAYASHFRCGIGIAHGEAIAGRLGTQDLAKIDVYGPVVNLASRLEAITKRVGVDIVIDEAVAAALNSVEPHRRQWRTRRLLRVHPEGLNPCFISELLPKEGLGNNLPENVRRNWERVLEKFLSKDWGAAKQGLEFLPPGDVLAKFLSEYMKQTNFVAPANWDGAIPMPKS